MSKVEKWVSLQCNRLDFVISSLSYHFNKEPFIHTPNESNWPQNPQRRSQTVYECTNCKSLLIKAKCYMTKMDKWKCKHKILQHTTIFFLLDSETWTWGQFKLLTISNLCLSGFSIFEPGYQRRKGHNGVAYMYICGISVPTNTCCTHPCKCKGCLSMTRSMPPLLSQTVEYFYAVNT